MQLENVADIYPLTFVQQGILFHSITQPDSGVYVDQVVTLVTGELDMPVFQQAWSDVINRHDALRAAFLWDGLDEPLQVIHEQVEPAWRHLNWQNLDAAGQNDRLEALILENRQRGLDLAKPPLFQLTLCRLDPQRYVLVICFHHIVTDGWSLRLILEQVAETCRANLVHSKHDLPPAFRFRDFVQWQLSADHAAAEEFWRKELAGFDSPNELFSFSSRLSGRSRSAHQQIRQKITPDLSKQAIEFAQTNRLTLNTVMQGVWGLIVSRHSAQDDTVFGVTVSGRTHELPGIEHAVGMFINTLPLRTNAGSKESAVLWLTNLQRRVAELQQWQFSDPGAIQKVSPVEQPNPLFKSILVFENYPGQTAESENRPINFTDVRHFEHSHYALALIVVPGVEIELHLVFDEQHCSPSLAERILEQVSVTLSRLIENPDLAVADLDVLTAAEKQWLAKGNAGKFRVPADHMIHELIANHATTSPEKTAVVFGEQSLTYAQLNRQADRVAHCLCNAGITSGDRIGLLMHPCPEMIVGILAVLKAGAAYVPLDPRYPDQHLRFAIDDAEIQTVLMDQIEVPAWPASETQLLDIKDLIANTADEDWTPEYRVEPESLAYVLYTSGSTGQPKGVMVTHGNLLHSTLARREYYRDPVDRFLLLSSFAFDSSVAGIFWSLVDGGRLVLIPHGLEQQIDRLADLIEQQQVTHTLCLPSLYRVMLANVEPAKLNSLTTVIVAGEACGHRTIESHFAVLPDVNLFNEYGPSEATVWSTVHHFADAMLTEVPIGRAVPGLQVFLLDENGRRVPIGACGEICVAGPQVATGYVNLPERTAQRFINLQIDQSRIRIYRTGDIGCFDDDSGTLYFVGRRDAQVKLRGHRIELEGIQGAINELPEVQEAVVSIVERQSPNGHTQKSLVAWCVPNDSPASEFPGESVKQQLADRLPGYMIPDIWMAVAEIPRLPNGKVNHRQLSIVNSTIDAGQEALQATGPGNHVEATLLAIWKSSLGLDHIGVNDNFFSLGGDSIISIQIISRSRQAGIFFGPGELAANPTVSLLAAVSRQQQPASDQVESTAGPFSLAPIQQWFFARGLTRPAHWNQSQLFEVAADFDAGTFESAFRQCVQDHDMLRARFEQVGDRWRQFVHAAEDQPSVFRKIDCGHFDPTTLDSYLLPIQSELDLFNGPLIRAALLRYDDHSPLLLIAVHHLIMDAVSWRILTDDLSRHYRRHTDGSVSSEQGWTQPAAYRSWVESLLAIADSTSLHNELDYWLRPVSAADADIPRDLHSDVLLEEDAASVTIHLPPEETRYLKGEAHKAFNTNINDLLLTALAITITNWTGRNACYLEVEGHGRDGYTDPAEYSGTIGWFTCSYPVYLEKPGTHGLAECIKAIKEQLRGIPQSGTGFGILKYLGPRSAGRLLDELPPPQMLFNYLGQRTGRTENRKSFILRPMAGAESTSRSPENRRSHHLEINAWIADGEFQMNWIYNRKCHHSNTIKKLASGYLKNLNAVLDTCQSSARSFTPSDFPETGLDQDQLDQLLDELE